MRSAGADFNFICTHQYKEFLGLKESIEEFMHTDESSKPFRAQLTGGGSSQTSDDITALYHGPGQSFPITLHAQACMDVLTKMFVSIVNICVPFGRPTQGPFPEWLKITASIKHTHRFLLNEPWLPSIYT